MTRSNGPDSPADDKDVGVDNFECVENSEDTVNHSQIGQRDSSPCAEIPVCDVLTDDPVAHEEQVKQDKSAALPTFGITTSNRQLTITSRMNMTVGDYTIPVNDLRTLQPGQWISDVVS